MACSRYSDCCSSAPYRLAAACVRFHVARRSASVASLAQWKPGTSRLQRVAPAHLASSIEHFNSAFLATMNKPDGVLKSSTMPIEQPTCPSRLRFIRGSRSWADLRHWYSRCCLHAVEIWVLRVVRRRRNRDLWQAQSSARKTDDITAHGRLPLARSSRSPVAGSCGGCIRRTRTPMRPNL